MFATPIKALFSQAATSYTYTGVVCRNQLVNFVELSFFISGKYLHFTPDTAPCQLIKNSVHAP